MIAELDIHGVFTPALLAWALIAIPLTALLSRMLEWGGAYAFVWNRPLADLALFVIVLGGVTALSAGVFQ